MRDLNRWWEKIYFRSPVEDAKTIKNRLSKKISQSSANLHLLAVAGSWSLARRNLRSGGWSCSGSVGAGGISRPVAKLPGDKKTIKIYNERKTPTNTHWQRWQGLLVRSLLSFLPPARAMERYWDAGLLPPAQAAEFSSSRFLLKAASSNFFWSGERRSSAPAPPNTSKATSYPAKIEAK